MYNRYSVLSSLFLSALIMLVLLPVQEARAQTACAQELAGAQEAYTFGRFDEAIGMLGRCLDKSNVTPEERQRAYRLMGLSYIGKDVLNEARASVRRLLELVPDYRPDPAQDPPPFVEMIEDVRNEMEKDRQAVEPPPPVDRTPETPPARPSRGGISKWLLIGGGALLAGAAAVLLLSGSGGDDGGGDTTGPTTLDEVEPNNSTAQAQVIRGNPPVTVRGNVEVGDTGALEIDLSDFGVEGTDDLEDLYRITLTSPGLNLTLSGLSADCDLYLLDAQATGYINNSINEGTATEVINEPNLAAGTYLIGVTIFDLAPGAASTSYTLTINGAVSGNSLRAAQEALQRAGGAGLSENYRLVAGGGDVPLDAVFDPAAKTRTAYYEDGARLVEYDGSETFRFRPGGGFWVQGASSAAREHVARETPVVVGDTYGISLHAGWNIVSNPFEAAVDWRAVQAVNGITQDLWCWDGRYTRSEVFAAAQRGEACYFMNVTGLGTLEIPFPGTARRSLSSPAASASALAISVYREGFLASSVEVGLADDASEGLDAYDQFAPPGYFESAGLRLVRPAAEAGRPALAREFRPWRGDGQQFDLVLEAPRLASVTLRVDGMEAFAGYAVSLIDPERSAVYDLREQPSFTLTARQARTRFTLVVGSEAFAASAREALDPEAAALSNYPNPFNPRTRISYTVPPSAAQETVRLDVFDAAGRLVRVLVDGTRPAGTYQVEWDGTDAAGLPVASGMYLSRLQAGPHRQIRKMLLMK